MERTDAHAASGKEVHTDTTNGHDDDDDDDDEREEGTRWRVTGSQPFE